MNIHFGIVLKLKIVGQSQRTKRRTSETMDQSQASSWANQADDRETKENTVRGGKIGGAWKSL